MEEAAATLGASRLRTFVNVIAPSLMPTILTGFALAFARAIGEYGSIVFISGNQPFKTEIAPYLIYMRLEEYDYTGRQSSNTESGRFSQLFESCKNLHALQT